MLSYRDSRLTQIALGLFFLAVAAYAYFEVRGLLFGPHIFIASDMMETHDQFVKITGHADHIASLSVDGAPVAVTTLGAFEIPYLLAPGVNRIELEARDNYKHAVSKTLEIVYLPSATSSPATSRTVEGRQLRPDEEEMPASHTDEADATTASAEPTFRRVLATSTTDN